jgi:hypothetical protein
VICFDTSYLVRLYYQDAGQKPFALSRQQTTWHAPPTAKSK